MLSENRLQLAELLSQLIEQQQLRRKDLKQLLEEMEAQRQNQAADYWLVQYQRLMDNMPESIQPAQQFIPSAPAVTPEVATAPPIEVFMETNCVICFDSSVSLELLSINTKVLLIILNFPHSAKLYFYLADICAAVPNAGEN